MGASPGQRPYDAPLLRSRPLTERDHGLGVQGEVSLRNGNFGSSTVLKRWSLHSSDSLSQTLVVCWLGRGLRSRDITTVLTWSQRTN